MAPMGARQFLNWSCRWRPLRQLRSRTMICRYFLCPSVIAMRSTFFGQTILVSSLTRAFLTLVLFSFKKLDMCDSSWQAYKFVAAAEQFRAPRIVRVGVIQNATVLPTNAPYAEQRGAIMKRVGTMIDAAATAGVNILCLQVKGGTHSHAFSLYAADFNWKNSYTSILLPKNSMAIPLLG